MVVLSRALACGGKLPWQTWRMGGSTQVLMVHQRQRRRYVLGDAKSSLGDAG